MTTSRALVISSLLLAACAPTRTAVIARTPRPLAVRAPGVTGEISVTRLAHATVLLEINGARVLTDPWFTESSQYHPGEPLGMSIEALPRLDAIVASHDHYDHFDTKALGWFRDKSTPLIVAPGMRDDALEIGFTDVRELAPWRSTRVRGLTITAVPGKHSVTEVTYVLQKGGDTVYFGADTELIPELDEVARRFPSIQLALLAVNGLAAFGNQHVMNAEQAATLAAKLRPAVAVPTHYAFHGGWFSETFVLSYDGTPTRFARRLAALRPATSVRILPPGQRLTISAPASPERPSVTRTNGTSQRPR